MEMRLEGIQFVVGSQGKPTAVLVDIATWEQIVEILEDAEDIGIARQTLAELDAAGGDRKKAGLIHWEEVRAEKDTNRKLANNLFGSG